jgi:hypothetical protein
VLADLEHFGITTRRQLAELIEKHRGAALEADAAYILTIKDGTEDWMKTTWTQDRLAKGVFATFSGLTRRALLLEYGDAYLTYSRRGVQEVDGV